MHAASEKPHETPGLARRLLRWLFAPARAHLAMKRGDAAPSWWAIR
jgi:hypothetical protein